MLLWANKCLTPFLKVEKSVVGFCIFVYQVKTYAFLVNELRCWESCWLSAQKKIDCICPHISTLYTIIWTHWTPFKVVRPFKVKLTVLNMRSHALPHRLRHQFSGIVAFSQRHFLAYTYGQAGTTRSIYPLLSPGATWPLTPLGSQAIPRRSVSQNTRQPVRLLSLCAGHCISPHPSPLSHGCLLRGAVSRA